jgi:esterase/lipase
MRQRKYKGLRYAAIGIGGLILLLSPIFWPWGTAIEVPPSRPAVDYAAALQRIEAMRAAAPDLHAVCQVQLLTTGQKTARAYVLVHGYTNCPEQFMALGRQLHALGHNVLLAPLPYHGLPDRMTEAHAKLKAEEIVAYAQEVVDIAQGLGDYVGMTGLSAGGVTTAWAAQHRADLDVAVLISPAFGFKAIPGPMMGAMMNVTNMQKNSYMWWNPELRDSAGLPHVYPRFATHTLAQLIRLGFNIQKDGQRQAPAAGRVILVTNAHDAAINNEYVKQLVHDWKKRDNQQFGAYEFPIELKLDHDMIDPLHPDANIAAVYPKLIELLTQ